jgi:hypothetical protein
MRLLLHRCNFSRVPTALVQNFNVRFIVWYMQMAFLSYCVLLSAVYLLCCWYLSTTSTEPAPFYYNFCSFTDLTGKTGRSQGLTSQLRQSSPVIINGLDAYKIFQNIVNLLLLIPPATVFICFYGIVTFGRSK